MYMHQTQTSGQFFDDVISKSTKICLHKIAMPKNEVGSLLGNKLK